MNPINTESVPIGVGSRTVALRIAVIHDWLVTYGGAERVLEEILNVFPQADLFSLVDRIPEDQRGFIQHKTVTTSFLQKFPYVRRLYRRYLPFMPRAVESLDLSGYDLVISSSHAVAKGVLTNNRQVHISYFNGIMNYVWGQRDLYLKETGLDRGIRGALARSVLTRIQRWDLSTADRVDHYVANSAYMDETIKKIFGRSSTVIHPPVDTDKFTFCPDKKEHFVAVARLVPIKRIDLIAQAFSRLPSKRLVIVGDGPEMNNIRAVSGSNVTFLGFCDQDVITEHISTARALITASEEPFGIATVEAQACGTPVAAFGKGGALETVLENETGIYFHKQHPDDIAEAIERLENSYSDFDPHVIRRHALKFSKDSFQRKFLSFVEKTVSGEASGKRMGLLRAGESSVIAEPAESVVESTSV